MDILNYEKQIINIIKPTRFSMCDRVFPGRFRSFGRGMGPRLTAYQNITGCHLRAAG